MKWIKIEENLKRQGLVLFTSRELRRATGLSPMSAKFLLIRYIKNGLILKLKEKRGLYCLKHTPPHSWLLANRLLQPSYISFETALSYYGSIPETVYGITSVTSKSTRTFKALGKTFSYQKIKTEAYHGYQTVSVEGSTVLMAEKEKALADTLYFVFLKKKLLNDRLNWALFNKKKALFYLKAFRKKGLEEWANNVIGKHN